MIIARYTDEKKTDLEYFARADSLSVRQLVEAFKRGALMAMVKPDGTAALAPRSYVIDPLDAGTVSPIEPADGVSFTLEELYAAIQCEMIEVFQIGDGKIMIADEEGAFTAKETNIAATALAFGHVMMTERGIVGRVIICDDSMVQ